MEYYSFRGGKIADLCLICRGAAGVTKKAPLSGCVSPSRWSSHRHTDAVVLRGVIYADAAQQFVRRYRSYRHRGPELAVGA